MDLVLIKALVRNVIDTTMLAFTVITDLDARAAATIFFSDSL